MARLERDGTNKSLESLMDSHKPGGTTTNVNQLRTQKSIPPTASLRSRKRMEFGSTKKHICFMISLARQLKVKSWQSWGLVVLENLPFLMPWPDELLKGVYKDQLELMESR
jgi:hypothetical protein